MSIADALTQEIVYKRLIHKIADLEKLKNTFKSINLQK